jgi:DNA-binding MarR family transcriptional regulator
MHNYPESMSKPDLSYLDCNCFAIRQAARFVSQLYERHVSQAGVTAAQFTLLAAIAKRPAITMIDLSELMVMDRTTLVRALKPLQRDGIVIAETPDASSRAVGLSLSESGKKVYADAAKHWRAAQKEFEEKFGHDRADALRKSLYDVTSIT